MHSMGLRQQPALPVMMVLVESDIGGCALVDGSKSASAPASHRLSASPLGGAPLDAAS